MIGGPVDGHHEVRNVPHPQVHQYLRRGLENLQDVVVIARSSLSEVVFVLILTAGTRDSVS